MIIIRKLLLFNNKVHNVNKYLIYGGPEYILEGLNCGHCTNTSLTYLMYYIYVIQLNLGKFQTILNIL